MGHVEVLVRMRSNEEERVLGYWLHNWALVEGYPVGRTRTVSMQSRAEERRYVLQFLLLVLEAKRSRARLGTGSAP